ncbi:MAG: hypothetical protein QM765_34490 [Myxococcales bacterium]
MLTSPSPADPARESRRTRWAVVGCGIWALLEMARFWSPKSVIDDAWISFRIARNLLATGVPTFDPGLPPVEAMTNFLWTVVSAGWLAALPHVDPVLPARAFGAFCHLVTVVVAAGLAAEVARAHSGRPSVAALFTGLVLAFSGWLAYHATAGLETPLYAALFVVAMALLQRALSATPRAGIAVGICLGLLGATRPEGVLVGLLVCGVLFLSAKTRSLSLSCAVPFAILVGALEAYRWVTFHALVPNTFYAKPPAASLGVPYLGQYLLLGLGILAPLAALRIPRGDPLVRILTVVGLVMAAGTVWSGGDWMPGWRRFTVTHLALAMLMGIGAACAQGGWRKLAWGSLAAFVAAAIACIPLKVDGRRFPTEVWGRLGQLAQATPGIRTVALYDIGRFGWEFQGHILDLAGLADTHIARQRGRYYEKEWDEAYFRRRSPELVLLFSNSDVTDPLETVPLVRPPEEGLLATLVASDDYLFRASFPLLENRSAFLLVFHRADVELPEELWGPKPEKSLRERMAEAGLTLK